MFNPVAPHRYLLPNLYMSVVDIANPDLFAYGSRTWISLDIARFYFIRSSKTPFMLGSVVQVLLDFQLSFGLFVP